MLISVSGLPVLQENKIKKERNASLVNGAKSVVKVKNFFNRRCLSPERFYYQTVNWLQKI